MAEPTTSLLNRAEQARHLFGMPLSRCGVMVVGDVVLTVEGGSAQNGKSPVLLVMMALDFDLGLSTLTGF